MNRGDVHWFRGARKPRGHEQRGGRYAVVVQSDELRSSTVLIAPTSFSARPAGFRPEIEVDGQPTRVIAEQLRAVDPQRLGKRVERLELEKMGEIDEAIRWILAL